MCARILPAGKACAHGGCFAAELTSARNGTVVLIASKPAWRCTLPYCCKSRKASKSKRQHRIPGLELVREDILVENAANCPATAKTTSYFTVGPDSYSMGSISEEQVTNCPRRPVVCSGFFSPRSIPRSGRPSFFLLLDAAVQNAAGAF